MEEWVSKDLQELLVMLVRLEKWVPRVFKACLDLKDLVVPRVMVDQVEKMVFLEMLVPLVMLVFLEDQVCLDQLDLPALAVLMEQRVMLDLLAHKVSKVFQDLKDLLVNLVKREL